MKELATYRHTEPVQAMKIERMFSDPTGCLFESGDKNDPVQVHVNRAYMLKHNPLMGGYYVRYFDGRENYIPAAAFEASHELE